MAAFRINTIIHAITFLGTVSLATPIPAQGNFTYDYVIVGGGPAGLVLAEQLSRDHVTTVAVLEAGPDGIDDAQINTPAYYPFLKQYVWNYTTIPEPNLGGNQPEINQGRVYGGGSAVNGMAWCRGSASLFDEWAIASGNKGLAWSSLLEEFKETAHYTQQTGPFDIFVNESVYGTGPLEISRSAGSGTTGFDVPFGEVLESALNLTQIDMTDGSGIGVDFGLSNIVVGNRTRSYSRNTFGIAAEARENVNLFHGAQVYNIGFTDQTATHVTYLNTTDQASYRLNFKEVIVSGGAINTPKLLLLSGIGPKDTLDALKIPVVADIPAVGQNLWDHLFPVVMVEVPPNITTVWQWAFNATGEVMAKDEYADSRAGPLGWDNGFVYGGFRVPDSVFDGIDGTHYTDLPEDRPHILIEYSTVPFIAEFANRSVVTAWVSLVQPEVPGYVSINTTDYMATPLIYSNYYGSPADEAAIKWAYKKLRMIMSSDALKPVVVSEIYPGPDVTSDEDVWKAIQAHSFSFHHPMGTCAIGKALDDNWRLHGLNNIRVVDSSAFPYATTCHPQSTVYALASRAAKDIMAADC